MEHPSPKPQKRLLLLAYAFPPAGGVGVQRALKFVKYLPEFGWDVTVLTAANPSVPLRDEALCKEIPEEATVLKAKTLEPGYRAKHAFSGAATSSAPRKTARLKAAAVDLLRTSVNLVFQPDLQLLWIPGAVRTGLQHLDTASYDAVMVTAPPFSSFLAGAYLARRANAPLVLDYRDEWSLCNQYWENRQQGALSQRVQGQLEKSLLKQASLVLATTESSAASLRELTAEADATAKVECIYNGFDPEDFQLAADKLTRVDYGNGLRSYRLAYTGTLWNLNRVQPLVDGVRLFCERNPIVAANLELVVAGRKTATEEEQLTRLNGLPCKVVSLPFLEHQEAIRLMKTSDGLVLLNSDVPHADRIVSGKAFEYIGAERTIYVISPPGDMWRLLDACPYAHPFEPSNPGALADVLSEEMQRFERGLPREAAGWDPHQHSRRTRAAQLDALLRQTCTEFVNKTVR